MGRHNVGADYYDKVYQGQIADPSLRREAVRMPAVIPHIQGSVLDLGCGLGEMANLLGDREYLGVDFSPVAIQYARENTRNPNARFRLMDFRDDPALNQFDTVLLLEVLEHAQDPTAVIGFARRHAQKRIIATVPIDMPDPSHIKPQWNEADLRELLGELAVCEIIGEHWWLVVTEVETTVSVCMIVRNEEVILTTAVESTAGLADEIVVLDTGSTDRTVTLAESLGCKVLAGGDRMNKGQSRNQAAAAARGDWVVVLDADERIADPVGLRKFLQQTGAQAVYVKLAYMDAENKPTLTYPQMRCWRRGAFKYRYRAHEVPVPVDGWGEVEHTDFVWEHRPPSGRAWKSQYTLDRLLLDIKENPDDARPLYYLGRQYVYRSQWEKGIESLTRYLEMPGHDEADAWLCLSKCYAGLGNETKQIRALHGACAAQPERREWWGALAVIYHAGGQDVIATGLLKCALEIPLPERTYASYYWYGSHIYDLLARCLWKLGRYDEGYSYASKALALVPDNQRLRDNLAFFEEKLCLS